MTTDWPQLADYLWDQMFRHVAVFFPLLAQDLLQRQAVRFLPWNEAVVVRGPAISIPVDVPCSTIPAAPWRVPFNGTQLTLWNRLPFPDGDGWRCLPNADAPLWYAHSSGALLPAWNLFANTLDLLTLREERESSQRDRHGRFTASASPRYALGLLEVPAFNEAAAALVAACAGLADEGAPRFDLQGVAPTTSIVLSHDCDILLGNDWVTQAIRLLRVVEPLAHLQLPRLANLWWAARNAVFPRDFYFDNVQGLIEVERMLGFRSAIHILNGAMTGRFGRRSKLSIIPELCSLVPEGWDIAMHYNYDTLLDHERFEQQQHELASLLGWKPVTGIAHYLRFDPHGSWRFLAEHGIRCDGTAGYAGAVGYRCGIGGVFQAWDVAQGRKLDLWETPLAIMESAIVKQYGDRAIPHFRDMMTHLSCLGGAISALFHPGMFFNPEFPEFLGLYRQMLGVAKEYVQSGVPAIDLAAKFVNTGNAALA